MYGPLPLLSEMCRLVVLMKAYLRHNATEASKDLANKANSVKSPRDAKERREIRDLGQQRYLSSPNRETFEALPSNLSWKRQFSLQLLHKRILQPAA